MKPFPARCVILYTEKKSTIQSTVDKRAHQYLNVWSDLVDFPPQRRHEIKVAERQQTFHLQQTIFRDNLWSAMKPFICETCNFPVYVCVREKCTISQVNKRDWIELILFFGGATWCNRRDSREKVDSTKRRRIVAPTWHSFSETVNPTGRSWGQQHLSRPFDRNRGDRPIWAIRSSG